MQIFFLEPLETFFVDVVTWIIFHLSIGYLSTKIPFKWLNPDLRFFNSYDWEKDGGIYDKIFHVRAWKDRIPDGSRMYRGTFSIKRLPTADISYLTRWLSESIRSEICHWAMIIPGGFFFLWNDLSAGRAMVIYAILNNIVPIIMQRYNRPRMRKLIAQLERNIQVDYSTFPSPAPNPVLTHSCQ